MPEIHPGYRELTEGPLGLRMTDEQARSLDGRLQKLEGEPTCKRLPCLKAGQPALQLGERADISWISTESVDRFNEVMIASGMDDSHYQMNPMVTLNHSYYTPPVGRSLWRKKIKDGDLVGIQAKTYYPVRPEGWDDREVWAPDRILALIQAGLLQGKSIGFLPLKSYYADPKTAERMGWAEGTLVHEEWLLLEYACCAFPVNQDSIVQAVAKSDLRGDDLALLFPAYLEGEAQDDQVRRAILEKSVRSFMTEESVQRAVTDALAVIDLEAIVRRAIDKEIGRRQGRI